MLPGTYKRTAWFKKKASIRMKKYWSSKRKSEAIKNYIKKRKAAGITVHTNGKPYKNMTTTKSNVAPVNTKTNVIILKIVVEGNNLDVKRLVPSQQ